MNTRNYQLDAMRGLAALAVLIYHIAWFYGTPALVDGGYLAVDFFFALSGLVIASSYDGRLNKGMAVSRFLKMRVIRLYPIFFIGLSLGLAKSCAQIALHQSEALTLPLLAVSVGLNYLFLPVPFDYPVIFPLNSPLWSLFMEMLINVIYALVLARLTTKALAAVLLASTIAMILTVADHPALGLELGGSRTTMPFGFARVMFGFCLGMLLSRNGSAVKRESAIVAAVLAAVLIAFLFVPVPALGRAVRDLGFAFVAVPLILGIGMRFDLPARWRPAAALLGDLSYPVYGLHYPIMLALCFLSKRLGIDPVATGAAVVTTVIATALLAERYLDRPLRAWLSVRAGLRESAQPQIVAETNVHTG